MKTGLPDIWLNGESTSTRRELKLHLDQSLAPGAPSDEWRVAYRFPGRQTQRVPTRGSGRIKQVFVRRCYPETA
jgi:hypothetical protein